jgi:hypothetical protein
VTLSIAARSERAATTELIALIAEFDARRLYLAAGYPSLFVYCRDVLHLSEHEAYNRIEAARASRRFPMVLDALRAGTANLTTIRQLAPHLTWANHADLLDSASHLRKSEVEELIASRFPRPDIEPSMRNIPGTRTTSSSVDSPGVSGASPPVSSPAVPGTSRPALSPGWFQTPEAPRQASSQVAASVSGTVAPLSPGRYEIRFTVNEAMREKVRRAQDLLRHATPTGALAEIFERAVNLLLEDLARKKLAEVRAATSTSRPVTQGSRHIPAHVRRSAWARDAGRCAFVATNGRRCTATAFLEFHHVRPYAVGGAATLENIQLRCRAHNAYEADLFYGPMRSAEAAPG